MTAVVTNPDRPAGRGMELRPSPVKAAALAAGLPVVQPERARDADFAKWLSAQRPDVATVVAYGKILPQDLLEVPRLGFVNVHFSLLPAYRGAAPVQRALMDGVQETGVSIMVLTEGMDEGPILLMKREPVGPDETSGEVGERLSRVGAPLLVEALQGYSSGSLNPEPQQEALASYAPKIGTAEARIDWTTGQLRVKNHVRGLAPLPAAWTEFRDLRMKVFATVLLRQGSPGPGVVAEDGTLRVGTGDRIVEIREAQLSGKKRMTGIELARGLRTRAGERFV